MVVFTTWAIGEFIYAVCVLVCSCMYSVSAQVCNSRLGGLQVAPARLNYIPAPFAFAGDHRYVAVQSVLCFHFVCVPRRVHGPSPEAASIGADFCIVPDVGTYRRCELRVLDPSSECRKAYTHSNSTVHMFSA